jgi:hypothetical protein
MLQGSKFRIIDVSELGQPALIINAPSIRLLLLDDALDHDERTAILADFMRSRALREDQ